VSIRVLYDNQIYNKQQLGGISRYFALLSQGLRADGNEGKIGVRVSHNMYLPVTNSIASRMLRFLPTRQYKKMQRLINTNYSHRLLKKAQYDIFHPTYFNTGFLRYLPEGKPFVLTIFDLIQEKWKNRIPVDKNAIAGKALLARKAAAIIAISEQVKADIVALLHVPAEKVHAIHLGCDFSFDKSEVTAFQHPKPYILFVGLRDYYKNFSFFVTALSALVKKLDVDIVCCGGPSFTPAEYDMFQNLGIAERIHKVSAENDFTLAAFYRGAEVFVFPSVAEGFGLPLLEAMRFHCPVVASDIPVFREIGGEAVRYFTPQNPKDLERAVSATLGSTKVREALSKKGTQQVQEFSWAKTVHATTEVYKSVLRKI